MNCLLLYNATQTYTTTVYEYLAAFARYSRFRFFFLHHDRNCSADVNPRSFDAIGIHYSVRLPFDQISPSAISLFSTFKGLKFLFIQDEYNYTHRAWYWIKRLKIDLVFTVVPSANVQLVYPHDQFPGTRFVSVLTGYVPESLPHGLADTPPSRRQTLIGYRGRNLPIVYGRLGMEKAAIGKTVREYAEARNLRVDIEWTEASRIYGDAWYPFVASSRATLGTESGSNVFDWNGELNSEITRYRKLNPGCSEAKVYEQIIQPLEKPGLMNQVSPRIFEAIALRTVLILYEGDYSGILTPGVHYIPLKRDGSNLQAVFEFVMDDDRIDEMARRAYQDIIHSSRFSYRQFIEFVDRTFEECMRGPIEPCQGRTTPPADATPPALTNYPVRAELSTKPSGGGASIEARFIAAFSGIWLALPGSLRARLKPLLVRLLRRQPTRPPS